MNHSAQDSQKSAANETAPGCGATPCKPGKRFPPCGHARPRDHQRADGKHEKRAHREPKNPRHNQLLIQTSLSRLCNSAYLDYTGNRARLISADDSILTPAELAVVQETRVAMGMSSVTSLTRCDLLVRLISSGQRRACL